MSIKSADPKARLRVLTQEDLCKLVEYVCDRHSAMMSEITTSIHIETEVLHGIAGSLKSIADALTASKSEAA